jgi:succinate-semialdehyde dehydrogenase/glutarate-semialdehyde dehydrogenase
MTLTSTPPTTTTALQADLFVDGQWRPGSDGRRFDVVDPSDGSVIAGFAIATGEDCQAAVDAAAAAQAGWAATAPRERSELLRAAYDVLTAEVEHFAELMVRENGKSWADAIGEATYAKEFFRWFAEEAVRVPGDYRLSPAGDKRIVVDRQPIGVSLLITPWNFPAAMATRKLAPALAAGCTTILKPARETPLTAAYVVDVLHRVGVPRGVVNLVTPVPTGPLVKAMIDRPEVRKVSFTGSTEVGRELLHACADTVVSASMELGGNAPLIVLPGADLDVTVAGALLATRSSSPGWTPPWLRCASGRAWTGTTTSARSCRCGSGTRWPAWSPTRWPTGRPSSGVAGPRPRAPSTTRRCSPESGTARRSTPPRSSAR